MSSSSQRKASALTRQRSNARGLIRVEVQAQRGDAGLIRDIAAKLRAGSSDAAQLRSMLQLALGEAGSQTAFDIFGSDLPEEVFDGVFAQARQIGWREVEF